MARRHSSLDQEIRNYIDEGTKAFRDALHHPPYFLHGTRFDVDPAFRSKLPVVKYMHPQYLDSFMSNQQFNVSRSEGFTWGDGIYVSPLTSVVSSVMYGRCGGIGWLKDADQLEVFDATQPLGIDLYQSWIQRKKHLYKLLTTTVHAPYANRELRNEFKRHFRIGLVQFRPDETHSLFSNSDDLWYAVSVRSSKAIYSTKIESCKWVLFIAEEFSSDGLGFKSFFDNRTRNAYDGPKPIKNYKVFTGVNSGTVFVDECISAYFDDEIIVVVP